MKEILVIDAPKNCEECPCCYGYTCSPLDREMGIWMIKHGKQIDCPLKPLPEKMDENEEVYNIKWFKYGFNTCVEVISNEQNDKGIQEKKEE